MTDKQIIEIINARIVTLKLKKEEFINHAVKKAEIKARIDELRRLAHCIRNEK